jgi:hypothetical protein
MTVAKDDQNAYDPEYVDVDRSSAENSIDPEGFLPGRLPEMLQDARMDSRRFVRIRTVQRTAVKSLRGESSRVGTALSDRSILYLVCAPR